MPHETLSVILGGGRGTRLAPLTTLRSKPAVPLAGKYRLIDVPISNSINAGIFRIYVLTQFNSVSLNRHVGQAYRFDGFKRGFVEILAAEQTEKSESWFRGTADAVRRHLTRFVFSRARRISARWKSRVASRRSPASGPASSPAAGERSRDGSGAEREKSGPRCDPVSTIGSPGLVLPAAISVIRDSTFSSSRTLPGHG